MSLIVNGAGMALWWVKNKVPRGLHLLLWYHYWGLALQLVDPAKIDGSGRIICTMKANESHATSLKYFSLLLSFYSLYHSISLSLLIHQPWAVVVSFSSAGWFFKNIYFFKYTEGSPGIETLSVLCNTSICVTVLSFPTTEHSGGCWGEDGS